MYDGLYTVWLHQKGADFPEPFYMKMNSGWDRGHSSGTTFTDKDCTFKRKDRKSIHLYPACFSSNRKPFSCGPFEIGGVKKSTTANEE